MASFAQDHRLPAHHPDDQPNHYLARLTQAAHVGDATEFSELLDAWQQNRRHANRELQDLLLRLCLGMNSFNPIDPAVHASMLDQMITAGLGNRVKLDLQHQVFHAVHCGVVPILEVLRRHGAKLEDPGENKTPLVHKAIEEGHLGMLRYLIDQGMDIEVEDVRGCTPLFAAVGRPFRAKHQALLISRGADRHAVDKEGRTLLHIALRSGHYAQEKPAQRAATVKRLLDWGVDPLRKARHGLSALEISDTCAPEVRAVLEGYALALKTPDQPTLRRRSPRL